MTEFVFDTYVIIEIIRGNPNYKKYEDAKPILNDFVFAETCYSLIKDHNYETALKYTNPLVQHRVALDAKTIQEATLFRHEHREKKFSYPDCISYIQAKKMGTKFLTGDKQFKGMPNIEFVQ